MEFIYGGHLLSLGASGIVLTVILLLDLPFNIFALIIPYLSSQVVYTYNHFREMEFDKSSNPERVEYIEKQKRLIKSLFVIYTLVLVILILFTNVKTLLFVLFVVGGGIAYTDFFKALAAKHPIGFKNFYISLFWALTVFLAPFFYELKITLFFLYLFFFVLLRFIVSTIFFDLKDIESDRQRNLKTFGLAFGKKRTIYILQIINLISLIPLLLGVYSNELPQKSLFLLISVFYGIYYLTRGLYLEGKGLRTLSYLVVDAEYIFWAILIIIGRTIV